MSVDDMVDNKVDNKNNNGKKRNGVLRGVLYTLGAGIVALGAYTVARIGRDGSPGGFRHATLYTLAGVAMILSLPRGCDIVKDYNDKRWRYKEIELVNSVRRDSIVAKFESQRPRDTTAKYLVEAIDASKKSNEQFGRDYKQVLSENTQILKEDFKNEVLESSKKYESLLEKANSEYTGAITEISKQNKELKETLDGLMDNNTVNYASNSRASVQNTGSGLERVVDRVGNFITGSYVSGLNVREESVPSYYLIDADKSDGEIQVYGVFNDGSKRFLDIASKASFAMNGGPANGTYTLVNKGARSGELYPGFMAMDDPVGISGAGDYNQHLGEIQQGAFANRSGIRLPNEIYIDVAGLVDQKKTLVYVHD